MGVGRSGRGDATTLISHYKIISTYKLVRCCELMAHFYTNGGIGLKVKQMHTYSILALGDVDSGRMSSFSDSAPIGV